jgi:putative glycosyltransferase
METNEKGGESSPLALSVVVPVFGCSETLRELVTRISFASQEIFGHAFEIILVVDGPDAKIDGELLRAREGGLRFTHVTLTRNFGQPAATMCGLEIATGQLVFLLDCDLDEAPEWLPVFYRELVESKADLVYGTYTPKARKIVARSLSNLYYYLVEKIAGLPLRRNQTSARLMSSRFKESLLRFRESEPFIGGLSHLAGYEQRSVQVEKLFKQKSSHSNQKLMMTGLRSLISFSPGPLFLGAFIGMILSVFSVFAVLIIVTLWLFGSDAPPGWTFIAASVWLLGGIQVLLVAMIGLYTSSVFLEVKNRPRALVESIKISQGP